MRIGLDLDSTLNHLDKAWAEWITRNHDPEFGLERWTTWNVHEVASGGKAVYDFLMLPGVFATLDVQEEAVRVTELLAEKGHELYIVTAFIPETCLDKCVWLRKHFPHINPEHFVFCNKKHLLDLDLLIDDGAHNAEGFRGRFLLYDQPWNQHARELERVKGWYAVEQWLHWQGYFGVRVPK